MVESMVFLADVLGLVIIGAQDGANNMSHFARNTHEPVQIHMTPTNMHYKPSSA